MQLLSGILRVCGPHSPASSRLTLHIRVLHEQQAAITQSRADRLGARKEKAEGSHHQVLEVELCVGVLLFLQRVTASGRAQSPCSEDRCEVFLFGPASC